MCDRCRISLSAHGGGHWPCTMLHRCTPHPCCNGRSVRPLVHSIGTASSVSAIAPHPDAAPSLLVTPDSQPDTPGAVAYELRVEGRGFRDVAGREGR